MFVINFNKDLHLGICGGLSYMWKGMVTLPPPKYIKEIQKV